MNEDISVAAAILTAEFIRKAEMKESEAYLLWRRMRSRMQAELAREEEPRSSAAAGQESAALMGGAI